MGSCWSVGRSWLSWGYLQSADREDECDCSITGGRCILPDAPRAFARALRWSTLAGTNRQVASGRVTAAGLFVARDSVCREQVLVGAFWLTISPLVSLGKASLEVFCVLLLFCFAALSFVGDGEVLPVRAQSIVIAASFVGLYAVARLSVQTRSG